MFKQIFFGFVMAFSIYIQQAQAQVWEQSGDTSLAPVDPQIRTFAESDFTNYPWLNEYTNVIVINKANEGADRQTLRLYVNGQLQFVTKVSTGREKYEGGCAPGQDPKEHHCSLRAYWSTTPVGYFDVDKLDQNYFSNLWKTWMPYSVFFEPGIATHQAPAGTEGKLGSRASGGCVRMHPNAAPIIFKTVQNTSPGLVPLVTITGELKKTAAGDVIRAVKNKTLYIVQNVVTP